MKTGGGTQVQKVPVTQKSCKLKKGAILVSLLLVSSLLYGLKTRIALVSPKSSKSKVQQRFK